MPILNVLPVPHPDSRDKLRQSTIVVIDILRASSTILEGLHNGAKEVIPVAEPEQAMSLKARYSAGQTLLSGERMGLKIQGFDMGNSPADFLPNQVAGKTIIMCSTNGTKAIIFASIAQQVFLGSFRNITAVVNKIKDIPTDIYFLGSGKFGQFCLEDMVCAGAMIDAFVSQRKDVELADSAVAAIILFKHYQGNILKMLEECEHGKYLISAGFQEDLKFCAEIAIRDRVPELQHGILR